LLKTYKELKTKSENNPFDGYPTQFAITYDKINSQKQIDFKTADYLVDLATDEIYKEHMLSKFHKESPQQYTFVIRDGFEDKSNTNLLSINKQNGAIYHNKKLISSNALKFLEKLRDKSGSSKTPIFK